MYRCVTYLLAVDFDGLALTQAVRTRANALALLGRFMQWSGLFHRTPGRPDDERD
jgi:hypothetical protein